MSGSLRIPGVSGTPHGGVAWLTRGLISHRLLRAADNMTVVKPPTYQPVRLGSAHPHTGAGDDWEAVYPGWDVPQLPPNGTDPYRRGAVDYSPCTAAVQHPGTGLHSLPTDRAPAPPTPAARRSRSRPRPGGCDSLFTRR